MAAVSVAVAREAEQRRSTVRTRNANISHARSTRARATAAAREPRRAQVEGTAALAHVPDTLVLRSY